MGQWTIVIQGTGPHHNVSVEYPKDADRMTAEFARTLRAAGHFLSSVTFTSGSIYNYTEPDSHPAVLDPSIA